MFGHIGVRDALQPYLGSKHALRCVCSELHAAYSGRDQTLFALKDPPYRAYFLTLPTHPQRLDGVILGMMRKGVFLIELSDVSCFYEVVYGAEQDRLESVERFFTLKSHIAACVETIYIDCHWIGYVNATTRPDGLWSLKPMYTDGTGDAAFDFRAFNNELSVYLQGWTNLKEVILFAPLVKQTKRATFMSFLYAETKRVVTDMKKVLDNPHHVKVIEVLNEGLEEIEYTRRALAFHENARA